MTRYLLGELAEPEQAALERKYFADPQLFDQVLRVETHLVDNYARGRLSPELRQRFEQTYLAHPERRERLRFAEALAGKFDQIEPSGATTKQNQKVESRWTRFSSLLQAEQRAFAFSVMLVLLFLTLGSILLFFKARRGGQELTQTQATQAIQEQRERELQQLLATERARNQELTGELERMRAETPQTGPAPPASGAPAFVSLLLFANAVRGADTGSPPTLIVPRETQQVRLQLRLRDSSYKNYQLELRAIGGKVLSRQNLKTQATKTGARFVVLLPAARFFSGDYMLTLKGVAPGGELEDVSKSLFRVEKKTQPAVSKPR